MRFDELELEDLVLDGLDAMNFVETTPVQEQTIPVILEGRDIIACAQTGTGKTAAFVLPLLNQLIKDDDKSNKIRAVIMVPTRELAQQIDMQIQGFSYFLRLSSVLVYGGGDGMGWEQQKRGMKMGADIVVATPGRLLSHLEHSNIDLSNVKHFILDEADRMLDMGFQDDIMKVVKVIPEKRQTILFSATMPANIRKLVKNILVDPVEVNVAISKPNDSISQAIYLCHESQKMGIIDHIFSVKRDQKSIIFSSSKQKVKDLTQLLKRKKLRVAAMHSDLDQKQREMVMLDFNTNKLDLLVATDIIARGIDINAIGLVINFDVPHEAEDYIHRIGRTGRADATGEAIMLVDVDDQQRLSRIEKLIEREIERLPVPAALGEAPEYAPNKSGHKKGKRGNARKGASNNRNPRNNDRRGHNPAGASSAKENTEKARVFNKPRFNKPKKKDSDNSPVKSEN